MVESRRTLPREHNDVLIRLDTKRLDTLLPVIGGVRQRVACHSAEALSFSVCDGRGRLCARARLATVFCEGPWAGPARLANACGPISAAAYQGQLGVTIPEACWQGGLRCGRVRQDGICWFGIKEAKRSISRATVGDHIPEGQPRKCVTQPGYLRASRQGTKIALADWLDHPDVTTLR